MEGGRGEALAKGAWFVSARRQLLAEHGEEVLARVARRMGEEASGALLDPYPSAWYPETTFQKAMAAVSEEVLEGDPDAFRAFIEACTEIGIHRFLRIVLSLASPAFVLGKMPAFWRQFRQNSGTLEVQLGDDTARLLYEGFPFFGDRNYRIFVCGCLRKTLELSCGERPEAIVRDYSRDHLAVSLYFRSCRLRR